MKSLRRGRWLRWSLLCVAVVSVLRLGLGMALPWLLDRAARVGGCALRFERSGLSLLGGYFALQRVEVRALESSTVRS